jgi:AraC-like DNA-binding protein
MFNRKNHWPIVYRPQTYTRAVREAIRPHDYRSHKIVAFVEPAIRASLSDATRTCCTLVHADTLSEAVAATRDNQVRALLISPAVVANEMLPSLARMLGKCDEVLTVALLAEHKRAANQGLLDLGGCGVRRAIDLSERDGWNNLRELVYKAGEATTVQILELVRPALAELSPGMRELIDATIRMGTSLRTVQSLASHLRIHPSSLMSRFFRAGLPAPKDYLAAARLIYASALFEKRSTSVARVADRLEYSSPQSFGRHIKTTMGMTAVNFRYRYSLQAMVDHFTKKLITPHREVLHTFDPFGGRQTKQDVV